MQSLGHKDQDLVDNACSHGKPVQLFQDGNDVLSCGCSGDHVGSVIFHSLEPWEL